MPPLSERARPSVRVADAGGVRRRRLEVVCLNDDDLVGVGFSNDFFLWLSCEGGLKFLA